MNTSAGIPSLAHGWRTKRQPLGESLTKPAQSRTHDVAGRKHGPKADDNQTPFAESLSEADARQQRRDERAQGADDAPDRQESPAVKSDTARADAAAEVEASKADGGAKSEDVADKSKQATLSNEPTKAACSDETADTPPSAAPANSDAETEAAAANQDQAISTLLSAPLTLKNLNELLATIDPRLAQHGHVGVAVSSTGVATGEVAAAVAKGEDGEGAQGATTQAVAAEGKNAVHADRGSFQADSSGIDASSFGGPDLPPDASQIETGVLTPTAQSAPADGSSRTHQPTASTADRAATPTQVTPPTIPNTAPIIDAPARPTSSSSPSINASAAIDRAVASMSGGGHKSGFDHGMQSQRSAAARFDAEATDATFTGQVTRGLTAALKQGGDGSVTIRLHPASLGQIRVQVSVDRGKVDVRFSASTPQARALLSSTSGLLRESVERRGFTVESLAVDEDDLSSTHRTDAVPSPTQAHAGTGTQPTPDQPAGSAYTEDHGGSASNLNGEQGHGGPRQQDDGRSGAERPDSGESMAGTAELLSSTARGAVRWEEDGVHDQLGRLMLRLDAVA